jgi:Flp pilus assembly protein TadD
MYSSSPQTDPPRESAYDLFSRGMRFLRDGHPHQAAMLLGRAKLMEPDKASIREALGRALFMSGRTLPARREFAKVVQIEPASDYAHFALALACERTGQRTRAIGHLKLAIVMRPGTEDYERALERLAG